MITSNCRGCGAQIVWAETDAGKRMPIDAKGEKRFTMTTTGPARYRVSMIETFTSHFATCPKAEHFRKGG